MKSIYYSLLAVFGMTFAVRAADWPQWGGTNVRNMVSSEKGMPIKLNPGKKKSGSEEIDMATTENCLWVAKLGSQSYGTVTVANGRVFVGTNNESPRSPKHQGDRGIVMCFDEKTGAFKWQLVAPKLGAGKVSDWEFLGMCSSPTIVGDKGYVVTNRCEILCFDVKGMEDGNQGMQDEAKYMTTPDKDGKPVTPEVDSTDADILWVYDMRKELGVFPHNIASNYPLVVDGKVYVATSNGVDWSHSNLPAPTAPSFVAVNAETGEYEAEIPADAKVSENIMHCNWSSPSSITVGGKSQIVFAAGDGWVYGMGPASEKKKIDDAVSELPIVWKYNACPKEYRFDDKGEKKKYAEYDGPSELIATPTFADGLLYVAIGQDPEHGEGVGQLSCIDPGGTGELAAKWTFKGLERTISTPAAKDGLLYACDYTGRLFCLDAKTGKEYWKFDTKGHIWSSPLIVDGKIYLGNEEGELFILAEGKELKEIGSIEFPAPVMGTPVAANGVLYLSTHTHLYAFKDGAKPVK
ncbi:MAG: PQQ-binding-like beta-propeller repeat protein [Verrucomicrobiaceae bacterium]|nr:PQQ-binding-like beta-propeller repeat protein [Verrucomicrobiaceae bacterium]